MPDKLSFPPESASVLESRLPPCQSDTNTKSNAMFVTLTFATSLDSSLSLAPGVRTRLSGSESKSMTHYLRSRHAAILVGVSTVLADDPALNCRIDGAKSQPRPIIIDPHLRWVPKESDKVLETCRAGAGLAPFVLTAEEASSIPKDSLQVLERHGGKYIHLNSTPNTTTGRLRFTWHDIFETLRTEGLLSVMVEGGGQIINSLLHPSYHQLVDSVIVTIAPTWLGQGGVVVSPDRTVDQNGKPIAAARLDNVSWHPFGEDIVLCGSLNSQTS